MIAWVTPGTGWATWGSTTFFNGNFSQTYVVSNYSFTSSTENNTSGSVTYGGEPGQRYITTSTTETQEVAFTSTTLSETYSTQHTTSSFVPLGSNSTTTLTRSTITQVTANLPVTYEETTTRTNTTITELTDTENENGLDFTIYQAVGNEVLWVHPLTTVSGYFEPYPAISGAFTATRTTAQPRAETMSPQVNTTRSTLTNPQITNAVLSFASTAFSTTTVTSASGSSMPMPTFTTTFLYQTTTAGPSYQFSVASESIVAGASTTIIVTDTFFTSISKSYQFGTYQAAQSSTTSFTRYSAGNWGIVNSFTYSTQVGPTSSQTNTTITAFSGIDGAADKPVMLQRGFGFNAGPPAMSLDLTYYGGSRAAIAGAQSGAYYSAQSTVFFETVLNGFQEFLALTAPQSSSIFPKSLTGLRGTGSNTTRFSVSWDGPTYTATSSNSSTSSTYFGTASAAGAAVSASYTKAAFAPAPILRLGGNLPVGMTGVADATKNLVKVGTGSNTITSMIGGQTTWSGNAALTFIEPISSVVINPSPSFEENADVTVWTATKYKQDPYPPYTLPDF